MLERLSEGAFADRDEWKPGSAVERAELAAFFCELGLGCEIDAEGLIDRLVETRSQR